MSDPFIHDEPVTDCAYSQPVFVLAASPTQPEPVQPDLHIAYMAGFADGKKSVGDQPRPQPLTDEQIRRHSILAADCPGASAVILASTVRRLAGITTQEPTA